jgi:mono/diheme cytochrome c family protein
MVASSAVAADNTGEELDMEACATCHGAAGMGEGPMAEFMTTNVPNLALLSQQNDGVYPMLKVIQTMDGRTGIRGHGSAMPVWGSQFKAESVGDAGVYGAEIIVRGKMLSLALYVQSLQEE